MRVLRIVSFSVLTAVLLAGCGGKPTSRKAGPVVSPSAASTAPAVPSHPYTPTVPVANADDLVAALKNAEPGQVIGLADGTYDGKFVLEGKQASGDKPIVVTGSANAVLDAGGVRSGYGFHVKNSSGVVLQGFSVRNAQKGIMFDGVTASVIDSVTVRHIGDEAIHLRSASSNNVVQGCVITDTGERRASFGEGVYLGSAESNWPAALPDKSDNNRVIGNRIGPNVRAEHIDAKEGTQNGEIKGNVFDGHGIAGENSADSWVDIKGNGYRVIENRGSYVPRLLDGGDGFQTHVVDKAQAYGANNVFARNVADLGDATGYGVRIHLKGSGGNVVCGNNQITNAEAGVANVPVTAACPV